MERNTHLEISAELVGTCSDLGPGRATCVLDTTTAMVADDRRLVHGGFVFGLADYAAMLAVNDPNVVLGSADVRFVAPVAHPARVEATATVVAEKGAKRSVDVLARCGDTEVLRGQLTCFVLPHHVLDPAAKESP